MICSDAQTGYQGVQLHVLSLWVGDRWIGGFIIGQIVYQSLWSMASSSGFKEKSPGDIRFK
jgi:hypothetical protein